MTDKAQTAMRELEEAAEKLFQASERTPEMTSEEYIKAVKEACRHSRKSRKQILKKFREPSGR
jgi:type VI protein secretion system component VasF